MESFRSVKKYVAVAKKREISINSENKIRDTKRFCKNIRFFYVLTVQILLEIQSAP